MPEKLTIKYVREYVKQFEYECISKKYINCHTKLEFRCNKNHKFEMIWNSFRQGHRCPYCARKKKKTIDEIKEYIKLFGYECLSKEYKNNKTKLKFKCINGHIYKTQWTTLQQGARCPYCAGLKKKTIGEIQEYTNQFGYECLSKKYVNAFTKLEFRCDKEHIFLMCWHDFQTGRRCPICYQDNRKDYTEEELQEFNNYKNYVYSLTNQNFHLYYHLINPNNLKRGDKNHLDHIYTVIDGFNNNIPPEVIASPINLQMLTAFDNMSKNGRSDMTKEMLYKLYNQFKKE